MNALATAIARHDLDLDLPLAAAGLRLAYGRREVLRGIDLEVPRGEVLGLIGRNGAGKSSLIGCLLGLLRPQGGQARLMGAPALALDDARKARLGYVPQQPQAFGWMKVGQLFQYLGQLYPGWDPAHAAALLRRWEIDPARAIGKLSPAKPSAWPWPARWRRGRLCWCWTSRPRPWIRWPGANCCASWSNRPWTPGPRCCSPATSLATWSGWPRGWRSCTTAACRWTAP